MEKAPDEIQYLHICDKINKPVSKNLLDSCINLYPEYFEEQEEPEMIIQEPVKKQSLVKRLLKSLFK